VSTSTAEAEAREKLAQCGRALNRLGLYGLAGHISLRIPDSDLILITPGGGLDKSRLKPEDLTVIDASGKRVSGPYPPPLETPIHTVVHEAKPEYGSIAHLHAHWATVFSVTKEPLEPALIPARCLGPGPLRTFDVPQLVTTPELGQQLNAALGDASAVLMRWHGITVVGRTLEEMFTRAVTLEDNARLLWEAKVLGAPMPLPREAIENRPTGSADETLVRTFLYYTNLERPADQQIHSGARYMGS